MIASAIQNELDKKKRPHEEGVEPEMRSQAGLILHIIHDLPPCVNLQSKPFNLRGKNEPCHCLY